MGDNRRGKANPGFQDGKWVWLTILAHVVMALVYTSPWDNYLVATGVWYYAPKLVSGIILGYVALNILSMTLYLAVADAFAIASGTWTIDPARSTGIFIGALPIEEALFFLVITALITFGVTLLLSDMSRQHLVAWRKSVRGKRA